MVSGNDEHVVPELPNESGVITPSYENEEEESPKTKGGFLSFLNKGQKEKTTTKDEGEVPADRKPSNAHVSLPIETKNIGGLQSINASVEKMEIASVPTFAESVAEDARDSSTGSLVFEDDDSDTSKVGAMRQRAQPNTKAAGRWWVMPAVAALLVIVAMAIFIFLAEKDGGPLHKVFSPMIGGAGHSSVVEPGLVSTQLDVAVVKEPIIPVVTSNHVAPDNALSLSSYGVVKDDAPVETVEPVSIVNDVPPEVVEPIQQHELPELIYSFSFAYENGDLNQFVGLFSNDAKVDEAQGKVSITNEYREFFQATDMRNMDIKELTWQPEGGKAKGQGDFELTVWRGGNIAPATIKGKIDIEVIKTQERLYIQKLSMATR